MPGKSRLRPTKPAYQQVADKVRKHISRKKLSPGDKLPTEAQLTRLLGFNHQTIRKGLAILVDENIIQRRVGAGTFVAPEQASQNSTGNANKGRDQRVGVVIPADANAFVYELIAQLTLHAETQNLVLTVLPISDPAGLQDAVLELSQLGCCAAITTSAYEMGLAQSQIDWLKQSPIPIVLGGIVPGLEKFCYEKSEHYGVSDLLGSHLICHYLKSLGYDHVALMAPDAPNSQALQRRLMGYSRFISQTHMPAMIQMVCKPEDMDAWLDEHRKLFGHLAVICCGDGMAIHLINRAHRMGIDLPGELGIMGTNNISFGQMIDPALSTLAFPYRYLAQRMLEHALSLSQGKCCESQSPAIPELVIRNSCGGRLKMSEKKLNSLLARLQKNVEEQAKQLEVQDEKSLLYSI